MPITAWASTITERSVLRRPDFALVSPQTQTARGWDAADNDRTRRLGSPLAIERLRAGFALQQRLVRGFQAGAVMVLAGTDAGGDVPIVPGWGLHDELALLVGAGLTPYQALRAATADAGAFLAAHFHQPPSGTVTPGRGRISCCSRRIRSTTFTRRGRCAAWCSEGRGIRRRGAAEEARGRPDVGSALGGGCELFGRPCHTRAPGVVVGELIGVHLRPRCSS